MGEGAAFFVLGSQQSASSYAILGGVEMIYAPESTRILESAITDFLASRSLSIGDIGLVLLGNSGDVRYEQKMIDLQSGYFKDTPQGNFKHLCGEYMTNSSFALWLASTILRNGKIPPAVRTNALPVNSPAQILIVNHFRDREYTLILVSRC